MEVNYDNQVLSVNNRVLNVVGVILPLICCFIHRFYVEEGLSEENYQSYNPCFLGCHFVTSQIWC